MGVKYALKREGRGNEYIEIGFNKKYCSCIEESSFN